MSELPTPPDLAGDPKAVEVLRVWVVKEEMQCSLQADAFEDPATWGALLAEIVHDITRALKENEGKDAKQTLREIVKAFQEGVAEESEA